MRMTRGTGVQMTMTSAQEIPSRGLLIGGARLAAAVLAVLSTTRSVAAGSGKADDIRAQREIVWRTSRSLRAKSLHFLLTLAAQDARMVQEDEKQFAMVAKRLEGLLGKDLENQGGSAAVAKVEELERDPEAWIGENFNPARGEARVTNLPQHETRATVDWSQWAPPRK
jgi:hypothetical protein